MPTRIYIPTLHLFTSPLHQCTFQVTFSIFFVRLKLKVKHKKKKMNSPLSQPSCSFDSFYGLATITFTHPSHLIASNRTSSPNTTLQWIGTYTQRKLKATLVYACALFLVSNKHSFLITKFVSILRDEFLDALSQAAIKAPLTFYGFYQAGFHSSTL